jgi:hypothetical protein
MATGVNRDDRRPDAEFVSGVGVAGLAVERGVGQHRGELGKSLDGPVVAVAPAKKWVRVSTATAGSGHRRLNRRPAARHNAER